MGNTYVVNRLRLEQILSSFKVNAKSVSEIMSQMDRAHRHMNALAFVSMLRRYGVKPVDAANILRRIGIDDVKITDIFNMLDEQNINETYGKVVELSVD
jgi:hypothetical protein